ncbi:MAG: methyltransferase [Gammaproteobacteria bacterium]|nr:methyltransferase [Gammaproteobacteria bacterium]
MNVSSDAQVPTAAADLPAMISYMLPMAHKPSRYLCTPPPGAPELNWKLGEARVTMHDGRARLAGLSLDRHGFVMMQAPTAVTDFYDQNQVERNYYPEAEQLVRNVTSAQKVVVFDYNCRSGSKEDRQRTGVFPPARFVHADYTPRSAPQRVRDLLPAAEADARLDGRYAFVNVWRPIKGPIENDTLSLCDAQSVATDDLVATDLIYSDRQGEFYNVTFNANHRWYYFRHLQTDEVLVFMNFDSRQKKVVPHVAFEDATAAPNAPPRESIEVRAIAFF